MDSGNGSSLSRRRFLAGAGAGLASLTAPVFPPTTSHRTDSSALPKVKPNIVSNSVNNSTSRRPIEQFFVTSQKTTVEISPQEGIVEKLTITIDLNGNGGLTENNSIMIDLIDENDHARYTIEIEGSPLGPKRIGVTDNDFDFTKMDPKSEYQGTKFAASGAGSIMNFESQTLGFDFTISLIKQKGKYQLAFSWKQFKPFDDETTGRDPDNPEDLDTFLHLFDLEMSAIQRIELSSWLGWRDKKFDVVSPHRQTETGSQILMLDIVEFQTVSTGRDVTNDISSKGTLRIKRSGGVDVRGIKAQEYLQVEEINALVATPLSTQVYGYKEFPKGDIVPFDADIKPDFSLDYKSKPNKKINFDESYGLRIDMGKYLGAKVIKDSLATVRNGGVNGENMLTWVQPNMNALAGYDVTILESLLDRVKQDREQFLKFGSGTDSVFITPIELTLMIRDPNSLLITIAQPLPDNNGVRILNVMGSQIMRGNIVLPDYFDLVMPISATVTDTSYKSYVYELDQYEEVQLPFRDKLWPHYEIASLQICDPYVSPVSFNDSSSVIERKPPARA